MTQTLLILLCTYIVIICYESYIHLVYNQREMYADYDKEMCKVKHDNLYIIYIYKIQNIKEQN